MREVRNVTKCTDNDRDDDHVLQMTNILGSLPPSIMAQFPRSSVYFDEKGEVIKDHVVALAEDYDIDHIPLFPSIETLLDQEKVPT